MDETQQGGIQIQELLTFLGDYNVKLFSDTESTIDIIKSFLDKYNNDGAFYIVDLGKIIKQYERWVKLLPNIRPYYAIKCNPDNAIIQLLNRLGAGFDCASKNEIAQVLALGGQSNDIIFANPCKESSQIKYARSQDIDMLTFDSESELLKIKLYHPNANLLVRIKIDDSKSVCKFGCKFGVELDELEKLFMLAKASDLNLVGVSFHVGSNCKGLDTYHNAIKDAWKAFDLAHKLGFKFNVLDIGGGFPGDLEKESEPTDINFENIATVIKGAIEEFFSKDQFPDLNVIAEPGRYFAHSSHTLVLNIIGKKVKRNKDDGTLSFTYYLNDGIYGSFNCIFFDYARPIIQPFNERDGKLYESRVFGQSCDSLDLIDGKCMLPDLAIGECVYCECFGAYTTAVASTFNGFQKATNYYIIKY